MIAKAFAPGNISCVFVIQKEKNPAKSGSLGMGFTVNKGVIATIKKLNNNIKFNKRNQKNNNKIYFNRKKINFPTVNSVIKKLTDKNVVVSLKSDFPLGMGFGISGASALATTYALNKLLNLRKSKKELALIAHIAEVENSTGLGDVVNQYFGGFLIKYESSYKFKVKRIPLSNKKIYYRYFSPIDTKKVISNKKSENRINRAGIQALNKIKKLDKNNLNLKNLIEVSKEFSDKSGLLKTKRVINAIKNIENNDGNASMIMLGNAVFSDVKFRGSRELIIKNKGAHLL